MTPHERAAAELHAALEALEDIAALAAEGRDRFETDPDRRAHLSYLWIVVGSRLKNHSAALDISRATGEFARAIAFRQKLAYTRPSKRNDELIWHTTIGDAPILTQDIRETLQALREG